ncbi:class I SAM-dependent DNA methyltransferase [Embleya sp. AB8]|uniref:class I SAM-dependent DNA methyltransferase n=1 Tax=Embleya sp. AB8 TaxID=3156304 RepID=UPI003C73EBC3
MSTGTEHIDFDHALLAYETVAADYEKIAEDPDFARWISFYAQLFDRYGSAGTPSGKPTGKQLLDLGCGTGLSTLAFRDLGYAATGFDLSPSMIELARAKPAAAGISFSVGDLRDIPDLGDFDVVTCIGEPLSYLTDDEQLGQAFWGVAKLLAEGGVFVFDMNTLGIYRRVYATTQIFEAEDRFEVWRGDPGPVAPDGIVTVAHDYFAREDAGWRRVSSRHVYRHHSDATVRRVLADAGLRVLGAHGITAGELTESGEGDEERGRKIVYVAGR